MRDRSVDIEDIHSLRDEYLSLTRQNICPVIKEYFSLRDRVYNSILMFSFMNMFWTLIKEKEFKSSLQEKTQCFHSTIKLFTDPFGDRRIDPGISSPSDETTASGDP